VSQLRVGLVGYGYWGPNLARNFMRVAECRLSSVADKDPARRDIVRNLYPGVRPVSDARELLESDDVDAIVIATSVSSHFPLAETALRNGKHVLVEKPMADSVEHAESLVRLAESKKRVLMVDHTFNYCGPVRKIRQLIESGDLGDLYYYDSVRVNLGLFQSDVNVVWDLAPHDFSVVDYLIGKPVRSVEAVGVKPVRHGDWHPVSLAFITIEFQGGLIAHFNVNWLSPVKMRRTLIGGSRKMVIYDHLDLDTQVKIFDKGIEVRPLPNPHEGPVFYRTGDMMAPKIDQSEPLEAVCRHFVECCLSGRTPLTDGASGARVVRMLDAAQKSIDSNGALVLL
jgi:predicted dehydrogenase